MGQNHVGIALQCIKIMARKSLAVLGGDQQQPGLLNQALCIGVRRRFPGILRFIHGNNELGEGLQPRKPGIINEELQKPVWRWNIAHDFLVGHSLRLDKHLVKAQQRVADIL